MDNLYYKPGDGSTAVVLGYFSASHDGPSGLLVQSQGRIGLVSLSEVGTDRITLEP